MMAMANGSSGSRAYRSERSRRGHAMRLILAFNIGLSLVTLQAGQAETFVLELPQALGGYGPSRNLAIDFGMCFTQIEEVRIQLGGTFTPGVGHGDGVERPVDPPFPWPGDFEAFIDTP